MFKYKWKWCCFIGEFMLFQYFFCVLYFYPLQNLAHTHTFWEYFSFKRERNLNNNRFVYVKMEILSSKRFEIDAHWIETKNGEKKTKKAENWTKCKVFSNGILINILYSANIIIITIWMDNKFPYLIYGYVLATVLSLSLDRTLPFQWKVIEKDGNRQQKKITLE